MHFLLGIDWIWQPSHMDRVPVAEAKLWKNTMHAAYLYTKWKEKLCFNTRPCFQITFVNSAAATSCSFFLLLLLLLYHGRLDNIRKGRLAFLALGSTTRRCSGCLYEMGDLMAIAAGCFFLSKCPCTFLLYALPILLFFFSFFVFFSLSLSLSLAPMGILPARIG